MLGSVADNKLSKNIYFKILTHDYYYGCGVRFITAIAEY